MASLIFRNVGCIQKIPIGQIGLGQATARPRRSLVVQFSWEGTMGQIVQSVHFKWPYYLKHVGCTKRTF